MVTYGGMSKRPVTASTSSFIFKVKLQKQIFLENQNSSNVKSFCLLGSSSSRFLVTKMAGFG